MNKNKRNSKLIKPILFVILFSIIISAFSFSNVAAALQVGDEIGSVLNTDIRTFINGYRIPSYNINNHSAVLIKDLINYGFDSVYNEQTRSSSVTYNPNKRVTPMTDFDASTGPVGTIAFKYVHTDIVAFVNGKRVESFNIKGNLAIFFGDLKDYGTFAWNNNTRESRFTAVYKPATPPVTSIALNRTSAVIRAGESLPLTVTVSPSNAVSGAGLKWTSSNINIAQVSGNNNEGYILAVSPGTATITVTSANGKSAVCTITVQSSAIAVTGIALDMKTAVIKENEWLPLTATVSPSNATDKNVVWTSSNPDIVTVRQDGYIKGVSPGTAVITAASANGKTAKCTITVQSSAIAVTGITLDMKTAVIKENEWLPLTATVSPSNATDKTVKWTSSKPAVAKVSQDGDVMGLAPGTTIITATSANGKTAVCTVTVQSLTVEAAGITLSVPAEVICVNEISILTAVITPADTTDKNLTWTSSNDNIVLVYSDGYIIGTAPGTAKITVKTANGKSAECTITVTSTAAEKSDVYRTMMKKLAQDFVANTAGADFAGLDNSGGIIKFNGKEVHLNYIFHPTAPLNYTQAEYNKLADEIKKLK